MAKTKKRRRKKHRGTQAGTKTTAPRRRPKSRQEAKARSRKTREQKLDRPPNWRSAATRAGITAVIFAVVIIVLGMPPLNGIIFAFAAFWIYLPLGFWTDRFMHRRHMRRKAQSASGEDKK